MASSERCTLPRARRGDFHRRSRDTRARTMPQHPQRVWLHTRLSRRDGMLHYVHMLDVPAASIESFPRLPNDA